MPKEYEPPKPAEPDPEPVVEDPKPDLDALAEERVKTEENQKNLEKQQVAYTARLEQLESMLQDKFAGKTPPPDEKPPEPQSLATAEDFLTPEGANEATRRIANAAANEMAQRIEANVTPALMQTRAAQFDLKLEKIKGHKYFKYVEGKLEEAMRANPKLRYAPEALDLLYDNLVGKATDDILADNKEPEPVVPVLPVHPVVSAPRARVAPPTGPVATPPDDTVQLTAAEESVRSKFAPYIERMSGGKPYTPEHFAQSRNERAGIEKQEQFNLEEK